MYLVPGTAAPIIRKQEIKGVMEKIKSLKDSGVFIKGVTQTIENKTKELKDRFLSMFLGTFGASLFGNTLAVRGVVRADDGDRIWIQTGFLVSPHPLKSF